jgi:hypothetical protein
VTKRLALCICLPALASTGCAALFEPRRDFLSNLEILRATSEAADFRVDGALFELIEAQILVDTITFYYRGVKHLGDRAWVLRFSEKASEQEPEALANVYALLPVIQEGRERFRLDGEGTEELDAGRLGYVKYTFDSPIRGEDGRPLPGRGIAATFETEKRGNRIIFHLNLDNWGDRLALGREALEPFLQAVKI